jgi:hypothetical protein
VEPARCRRNRPTRLEDVFNKDRTSRKGKILYLKGHKMLSKARGE